MFMFETTRGLFEGWLRAALVFSLAPLFATLTLVVQLTFLEPQLVLLADMRASGEPNLPAASAAFMLVLVASAVSFSAFLGVGLLAASFKLPAKPAAAPAPAPSDRPAGASIIANPVGMHAAAAQLSQPRVAAIAAAVAAMERRDQRGRYDHAASGHPARAPSGYGAGQTAERRDYARSARRASPRRAASQARRDA
jgi:type IV secretion system protein VirB6